MLEVVKKRLHVVRGQHGSTDAASLKPFKERIEQELVRANARRVGAFVEDISLPAARAGLVTYYTRRGWLPSEALAGSKAAIGISEGLPQNPSDYKRIARRRAQDLGHVPIEDSFTRDAVLDQIALAHPKRLIVVPEAYTNSGNHQERLKAIIEDAFRGDFRTDDFALIIYNLGRLTEARDVGIVNQLTFLLGEEDVTGVVAHLGDGHDIVNRFESSDAYEIEEVFPYAENGSLLYNPVVEAVRQSRRAEQRGVLKPDEAKIALAQTVIWKAVSQAAQKSGSRTEQQVLQLIWPAIKNFTPNDADKLQATIAAQNLKEAVRNVLAGK